MRVRFLLSSFNCDNANVFIYSIESYELRYDCSVSSFRLNYANTFILIEATNSQSHWIMIKASQNQLAFSVDNELRTYLNTMDKQLFASSAQYLVNAPSSSLQNFNGYYQDFVVSECGTL